MMRPIQVIRARLVVPALLIGSSAIAGAQLANASTAATGLSGAYTARARGYNALAWNPANLAMPGNPGFSLTFAAIDGAAGLKPIDLKKLAEYDGDTVPRSVREQWMLDVTAASGQKGAVSGGITALALSLGPIAFQGNTKISTDANLPPDAVEALLFGNAGRTGSVKSLNLAGATMQGAVYSTGAVGVGIPLAGFIPLTNFSLGVTGKYTIGHAFFMASDNGSAIGTNDITINFPAIIPDSASRETGNIANGMGIDLGAAWSLPGLTFGVSVQNVMNTFKWDTTKLSVTSFNGKFDNTNPAEFKNVENLPYANAPAALRAKVAALKFKPVISGGVSFDWLPMVTVSADYRQQVGDGIEVGPKSTIAAGAELRLIPLIPLRAGVHLMDGGFGASGGIGIRLLGIETGVAGFVRKRDDGTESGLTLTAIAIRP
jgi:hypothetical protein